MRGGGRLAGKGRLVFTEITSCLPACLHSCEGVPGLVPANWLYSPSPPHTPDLLPSLPLTSINSFDDEKLPSDPLTPLPPPSPLPLPLPHTPAPPPSQMNSFHGEKLPVDPLYDLPSWLDKNYPMYSTRPHSPFYDWTAWMQVWGMGRGGGKGRRARVQVCVAGRRGAGQGSVGLECISVRRGQEGRGGAEQGRVGVRMECIWWVAGGAGRAQCILSTH